MARLSSANSSVTSDGRIDSASTGTATKLSHMLARLQQLLLNPDSIAESRLRGSSLEREKASSNLQYARGLLLELERDAQTIKVQVRKQETQMDLIQKRKLIQRLTEQLQEYNELAENDDDSSDGEDILGDDTPSEETETDSHHSPTSATPSPTNTPLPIPEIPTSSTAATTTQSFSLPQVPTSNPAEPSSTLRARTTTSLRNELLSPPAGTSTGISTATTEALLTHNRTEQESLTSSLLAMAAALKESTSAFSSSLEEEKPVLDDTAKGLDSNELGMEAAQRKMGMLRSMTEGRGWWGRMIMYAWIAGLMVLALVVVFVLPKLRF